MSAKRRKGLKAWHVAGIILPLAVGALLLYAFWPELTGADVEDPREVDVEVSDARADIEVMVVQPAEFPLRSEATGHLAPWRRTEISPEVGGVVLERPIEEGQYVEAGDLLLRLDDRDEQIELEEAEAALLKARADYAVNQSASEDLAPADTAALATAREAYARARAAFDEGLLTRLELREYRRHFEAQEILAGKQRSEVQAVNWGLAQAEQQRDRAQLALSRTRVVAPFRGRVADLKVETGQTVAAGTIVLLLLEDDRMKVDVDVLEADVVRLAERATVEVQVPNFDDAILAGAIYSINPNIDPATGMGRVTVSLPNPGGRLISGLFANVALETGRLLDRLVVPANALLVRQGRDLVFTVQGGRAYWTYVTTGARSGDEVEIVDGLVPGDTVAVAGQFALSHDAPVDIARVHDSR